MRIVEGRLRHLAHSLALSLCALGSATAAQDPTIPFADLGQAYLDSHGKTAKAEDLPVDAIRSKWSVHATLGAFDLAYPAALLSDKLRVEELKRVCTCLLEMQARWVDWLAADAAKAKTAHADLDLLLAWVKGWKPPAFARAVAAGDKDLFKLLGAKDGQEEAARRLTELLCVSDTLGVRPKESQPIAILLAPTRREFVELLGYAGLLDPAQQATLWQLDATGWTTFWIGWTLVMSLEYPPWDPDPKFETGLSMDKFDKNGLEQHTVLQAANAWQWLCYGDDGAPYFHQAVAMNLAIAVCGEVNALEGDGWGYGTTGGRTEPYERFVPGGNSSGGMLPPIPAATQDTIKKGRWREGVGRDHFAAPLRKGQKNAGKEMMKDKPAHLDPALLLDKSAHFLLVAADEATKYVISAPFFGPDAKAKPYPPAPVILDYREFFRAYKCSFVHWLQSSGVAKDEAASAARFRDLLRKTWGQETPRPFEEIVKEVYGAPLSGKTGKEESLEWRFVDWLGKGR